MKLYKTDWLVVSADEVLEKMALVVDQGKVISRISWEETGEFLDRNPGAEMADYTAHILFPGFINAHMHQYGLLSHGIPVHGEIRDFEDFLKIFWWPLVEDRIRMKQIGITTRFSAAEMIRSGVTGFCDTLEAPLAEEGALIEQAKIVESIGMKAILSLESSERIDRENGMRCLDENAELIRWCRKNSRLVEGAVCTHTSFSCSVPFLKKAADMAESLEALWQFHLSESRYEPDYAEKHFSSLPVSHYYREGLLSSRVLASQCVKVTEEEIALLRETGVRSVHMPVSNCEVGGGFAPVPAMLKAGVPVALGSDGYDNNFLNVMKMAFLVHKSVLEDPSVMPARDVFRMATESGARALGWENCGTLETGKDADFVCLSRSLPTPVTKENIFDQLVVYGKKESISHVYRQGEALLNKGLLTTLDMDALTEEAAEIAAEFWRNL